MFKALFGTAIEPAAQLEDNMNHDTNQEETKINLFSLPLEIREQIYAEILSFEKHKVGLPDRYDDEEPPLPFEEEEDPQRRFRLDLDLRLYRVNKQMHQEAEDVFRRINTFVCIQTPFPDAENNMEQRGGCLIVATGKAAQKFKNVTMDCKVTATGTQLAEEEASSFIIALEDLDSFCELWFYYHMHHQYQLNRWLQVRLQFKTIPTPHIIKCLTIPFGRIAQLDEFDITGLGSSTNTYIKEIKSMQEKDTPCAEECLYESVRLKDLGNEALKAGNARRALRLYSDSYRAMHIIVQGRRRQIWAETFFDVLIQNGAYKNQRGIMVRMILRITLVANICMAHLKLEEYKDAYFWARRSINLLRSAYSEDEMGSRREDFPAANQVGKIYYRCAVAARALGKTETARDFVAVAAKWLPDEANVQKDNRLWGIPMLAI